MVDYPSLERCVPGDFQYERAPSVNETQGRAGNNNGDGIVIWTSVSADFLSIELKIIGL